MGLLSWLSAKTAKTAAAPEFGGEAEEAAPDTEVAVAELAEDLTSANAGLRVDASRALLDRWRAGSADAPAAAAAFAARLGELLADEDPMVRINGLAGVRLLRGEEDLSQHAAAVQALLRDPVAQVRTAAVAAAAHLPGQAARDEVRALLGSPEEPMRFQAACALADLRDPAALSELTAALEEDIRRQEALSAILTLGDVAALPAVAAVFEDEGASEIDRTMAAAALALLGDARGGEHLAQRIAEGADDGPVAAEMAGRLRVQEAVPALSAVAEDEAALARGAALRALGRLRAPGAEERLLSVAADAAAPEDLRMDAAEGLAELDTAPARDLLRVLAAQADGELGPLCAELLRELSHRET
jgi:HEAT repeat protein